MLTPVQVRESANLLDWIFLGVTQAKSFSRKIKEIIALICVYAIYMSYVT